MLANVRLEQDKEHPTCHKVYINENEVQRVSRMNFLVEPCEVPRLCIEAYGIPDFEGLADVSIERVPTVEEASKILREELLKHGDLYKAFSASIYSALNDIPEGMFIDEMPEILLKRIIGEE